MKSSYGMEGNMLDWDIIVSKSKLKSYYYLHFQNNILVKVKTLSSLSLLELWVK